MMMQGFSNVPHAAGPYTFQRFQALEGPACAHPPPPEALKLLQRLAGDPGIIAIMEKHRYFSSMSFGMEEHGFGPLSQP